MAVKASIQITISKVIDVYAVYRYYKLQSSTLVKPSKPTANPPSGWCDTEPAYVSSSTNTLYFVDCNVYSDETFTFSEVSKSSSYEAAKDAWNKANNAQNTVDNLEIGGRNLLLNTLTMDSPWTNANKKSYKYDEINNIYYRPVWSSANSSWINYITQTVTIQPNTEYTISFLAKRQSEDVNPTLMCRFDRNEAITLVIPSSGLKIDTSWKKYSFTFTTHAESSSEPLRFYAYVGTGAYDEDTALLIANVKLEKGNKPTDWTPAPEDSIAKIDVEYYLSTSATSLSDGSWTTKAPTWVNGKYMWSRTVTVDGAGNKTYSPSKNGVCIAGAKGNNGKDAAVISSTEPSDKTYLWCDTSVSPPVLKQWNGEEWIVVNDNAEQITQIYKEMTNSITQVSDNILMQVGEKTYSKEAVDRLLSDMNTSFEQTKNSFNFEFNRFQTALNDLSNSTDTKFENTSKYIRFVDGEIYIGVEGNPIMLRLRNDRLSFLENNAEVAYISNRTLYFTHAEVLKDLKIGRFAWVAMDSGYMALKLVE